MNHVEKMYYRTNFVTEDPPAQPFWRVSETILQYELILAFER